MRLRIKQKFALLTLLVGLFSAAQVGLAFSLIGIGPHPDPVGGYYSLTVPAVTDQFGVAIAAPTQSQFVNMVDPMGFPVDIKEFYRWNYPHLTYSFDASFVQFFGEAGMTAVQDAMGVLNDFFSNETRNGVSKMNLYEEYDGLFKTWKFNPSANAANVTDLQSLVLGLMVNHLGLGNPHKNCFVIQDILNFSYIPSVLVAPLPGVPGSLSGNFQIAMRNFDPYTYKPTETINGVIHSYTISSDHAFSPLGGIIPGTDIVPSVFDAVEYFVSSQNDFGAVAAIRDVFDFGGLPWGLLPWSPPNPTVFRTTGTFFRDEPTDSKFNKPRHALTFDDAGGLKYLYRTNNLAIESLNRQFEPLSGPWSLITGSVPAVPELPTVFLLSPANMNPQVTGGSIPSSQNIGAPRRRPLATGNTINTVVTTPSSGNFRNDLNAIVETALRGGIDSIQFLYTPFDSLLGANYRPVAMEWNDVFLTNALPTDVPQANPAYFSQRVYRVSTIPDIIFSAMDMSSTNGFTMPIISMPSTNAWVNNGLTNSRVAPAERNPTPLSEPRAWNILGPGQIFLPSANGNLRSLEFVFTKRSPQFLVQYTGAAGSQATPPNMQPLFSWGWITNTGPADYVVFPYPGSASQIGMIAKSASPPEIISILIDPGASGGASINRTSDRVLIYGNRLDTVTGIDILNGGTPIPESRLSAANYIVSDQLIVLPVGVLNNYTEGTGRRFQLENSAGQTIYPTLFNISSGVTPIILSTSADGLAWNTQTNLYIKGSGFVSSGVNVDRLQIFDATGGLLGRVVFNASVTISDNEIMIPTDSISGGLVYESGTAAAAMSVGNSALIATDHFTRQINVGRSATGAFSSLRNAVNSYTAIGIGGSRGNPLPQSSAPNISDVFIGATGVTNWSRGAANVLTVRGANLHLAQSIEFLDGEGRLIQVIDQSINPGSPPSPVSLRDPIQPSALRGGVAIVASPLGSGVDSFDLQITPLTAGWAVAGMFDSASGNNTNSFRRAVVRTPFGTAIAPVNRSIVITP